MLGHKRIPSREGGVEIVVEELATRMAALGHDVTCFNRRGHHVSGKDFDGEALRAYKGVRIRKVPTIDQKGLSALTSSFFAALLAAFGPYDVVHFHAEGPAAMLWLPKMTGKRCIVTVHGLDWARDKWKGGFASRYIKFGERMAARHADEIIVLSESVREYFLETYGRRTAYIPNGVSRPERCPAELISRQFGLCEGGYILFVGRIVPEKGLGYLIEAFKRTDTDKKLVIAGGASDTGEYQSEVRALAEGDPRIVFTGFVQGRLLAELYTNAYLYVLPSDLEGMPLSLLEAMSYGNCCLNSDIPECREVVESRAVTFCKGETDDLLEKLRRLIADPELAKSYRNGAADFICEKYNWDDVVNQTLMQYHKRRDLPNAGQGAARAKAAGR
jgi:glycosyltransferase involved in cell wall biosynthesis